MIESIRLTEKAKTQLTTLKRRTGIAQWNVLCRWAFCLSIRDTLEPPKEDLSGVSNVEMTWRTFGGPQERLYTALLTYRKHQAPGSHQSLSDYEYFSLHLNRGISRLLNEVGSIIDLMRLPDKLGLEWT